MSQSSNKNKRRRDAANTKPILRRQQAIATDAAGQSSTNAVRKKKDDADSSSQSDRRSKRAERSGANTGTRPRSKTVYSRATRDTGPANSAQVAGRQRSDAITSRNDARGPERRDLKKKPITKADDGTELWDGSTPPALSEKAQQAVLKNLEPKWDLGKGRLVYPTGEFDSRGKEIYAPLADDATDTEKRRGIFISIVPEKSLDQFTSEKLTPRQFEAGGGTIEAIPLADVEAAFKAENNFVVHTQRHLDKLAQNNTSLQQKWV